MSKRHLLGAALGGVAAAASFVIGSAGAQPPASTSAGPSNPSPLLAFTRPASAVDELPAVLAGALTELGQNAGATRRVASFGGTVVYVSLVDKNGYGICLQLLDPDGVGTSTCNALDGLSKGWLYLGTEKGVFGLTDSTVSEIQAPGSGRDGVIRTVVGQDGVYFVPRSSETAAASLMRADGSVAGTVPIGPEPHPTALEVVG